MRFLKCKCILVATETHTKLWCITYFANALWLLYLFIVSYDSPNKQKNC